MNSATAPVIIPFSFSLSVLGHAIMADRRIAIGPMLVHSAVTSKLKLEDEIAAFFTVVELPNRFQILVANLALKSSKGSIVLLLRNQMYTTIENIIQKKNKVQKRTMLLC